MLFTSSLSLFYLVFAPRESFHFALDPSYPVTAINRLTWNVSNTTHSNINIQIAITIFFYIVSHFYAKLNRRLVNYAVQELSLFSAFGKT